MLPNLRLRSAPRPFLKGGGPADNCRDNGSGRKLSSPPLYRGRQVEHGIQERGGLTPVVSGAEPTFCPF